jgi:hypothetical protein
MDIAFSSVSLLRAGSVAEQFLPAKLGHPGPVKRERLELCPRTAQPQPHQSALQA